MDTNFDEIVPSEPLIKEASNEIVPSEPLIKEASNEIVPSAPLIQEASNEIVPSAPLIQETSNVTDLFELLNDIFKVEENIKNLITLDINPKGIDIIKEILQYTPNTLKSISSQINEIIKDGVLNTDDVPFIVNLIKDIINLDFKKNENIKFTVENSLLFIKTLLEILIVKEIIKVDNREKVFKLIDVSFLLLTTSLDTKEDCVTCLKKIFKC